MTQPRYWQGKMLPRGRGGGRARRGQGGSAYGEVPKLGVSEDVLHPTVSDWPDAHLCEQGDNLRVCAESEQSAEVCPL